jgi:GNAT superfamily N-acetyltransferase/ASC-1-like (ASCH) protein
MDGSIQKITNKDLDNYVRLSVGLSEYYKGEAVSIQELEEKRAKCKKFIQERRVWGYFLDNKLVGYLAVNLFDKDHHNFPNSIFLSELFVNKKYRGRRIGKELVKYILDLNFPKEYCYFSITHAPKEKFLTKYYEDLGFKEDRVLKSGNVALLKNISFEHVAILKKSWDLLSKIVSGEKTIESRWYKNRSHPWNRVLKGDTIYFKDSGEKVSVKAKVKKVLQFRNLNQHKVEEILEKYGDRICLNSKSYNRYYDNRNYCILVFLEDVVDLDSPFDIDKSGYGNAAAWLCVKDIDTVKLV